MIVYNVTVNIDADVQERWIEWMKEVHIPDVMATGLFLESRMLRVLADDEGGITYAIQYSAADMDHYERYRAEHAPRLQAEMMKHFDGKFAAFRTLLEVIHPR
ncbi:MAG TPA: DUF4286 family protein [Flavobacteriales bacterium]|jgi:hypothetical protein|nr:DUF4286 family protein [Flavobacteriales bacterium]